MRQTVAYLSGSLVLCTFFVSLAGQAQGAEKVAPALDFKMTSLDGKPVTCRSTRARSC